jgi:hypothetical protein
MGQNFKPIDLEGQLSTIDADGEVIRLFRAQVFQASSAGETNPTIKFGREAQHHISITITTRPTAKYSLSNELNPMRIAADVSGSTPPLACFWKETVTFAVPSRKYTSEIQIATGLPYG